MVELTTRPALPRPRACTGGDVSNAVAITIATAAFFMASPFHANKRASGTNGCHDALSAECDLISMLLKPISTPFDF
jgi:hypothetical protein